MDGRRAAEFRFSAPRERSNRVAYDGIPTADLATLDLIRVAIRTLDLPDDLGTCESSTTFEYQRVRLRNADFQLPLRIQLHIIMASGQENDSRTSLSACHEFLGESTLRFDFPDSATEAPAASQAESKRLVLPPGVKFGVELTDGIDTGLAGAGANYPHGARACKAVSHDSDSPGVSGSEGRGDSVRGAERRRSLVTRAGVGPDCRSHPAGHRSVSFPECRRTLSSRSGLESRWVTLGAAAEAKEPKAK